MRCLWIARNYPYPANSGDLIYTSRLAESFAEAGADVTMLCRRRDDDGTARDGSGLGTSHVARSTRLAVRVVDAPMRSKAGAFATPLPSAAYRFSHCVMRQALREELRRDPDVVVIDSILAGWALSDVLRHVPKRRRPRIVYASHNHEASVRTEVARNAAGPRGVLLRIDAAKVAPLERRLVTAADLVTANTAEDEKTYREEYPDARFLVLMPGYLDRVVPQRTIDDALPRRAVIVGALNWIAKRINLEEFLRAADPLFAAAGAELVVVGWGPEAWLDQMRAQTSATRFTGLVDSVTPYLDEARLGIVSEHSGGGFKHKVLYYVFNRIPVAALDGSVTGAPLDCGDSMLCAGTADELARRALELLDDPGRLQRMQVNAFDRCAGRFDWSSRGEELMTSLCAL